MIKPIGVICSPFKELDKMPIQPKSAVGELGKVVIDDEYAAGLQDLEGFSHIYLIYKFHQCRKTKLKVIPFMDVVERGVFATRAPVRPNHIGLSIVKLQEVRGNTLVIEGVDVLDGTPLLDVKPYVAKFDQVGLSRDGWVKAGEEEIVEKRSDSRFR
ncbi:MAG: tRNA (N6-threonylcarbamoyladenosine(37)-N6)-methyltransferase TrmO [Deltaproteobacteria bacterium]|nr:tRNA (N6-threonylcarbamoyladenosine(37)-N6)-methyltransferase TrmO [Candidatus Tharpella sp.]